MFKIIIISLLVFLNGISIHCWDTEELEIFDLVEEMKEESFYKILGVNQDASLSEIKRAFRNLSTILHPDKNDAEDANVVFRNLVSVYETLKDSGKREKYDKVLKEGLPNWKSFKYYYRKARKVGLMEMCIILFVIITICQYLISWAVYLEKKYTMEQMLSKKGSKKKKANLDMDSILKEIPYPSIRNTLPFQIPFGIYYAITGTPSAIKESITLVSEFTKKELERKQKEKEEEEQQKKHEEEKKREKEERKEGLRRRKQEQVLPEKTDEELAAYSATIIKNRGDKNEEIKVPLSGGLWTDDDLAELVRLTKKYPGGTVDRWEVIASAMNRNVSEVTFMAYKLKDNVYRIPGETDKLVENINKEVAKKMKTKKVDESEIAVESQKVWSQEQQKALEAAIQKYPKGISGDRWQKISNSVPGKTKEECLARYKYLVELVKKQKEEEKKKEEEEEVENDGADEPEKLEQIESAERPKSSEKKNKKKKQEIAAEQEDAEEAESQPLQKGGGKKKNKRKEAKKNADYYYDSEEEEDENSNEE